MLPTAHKMVACRGEDRAPIEIYKYIERGFTSPSYIKWLPTEVKIERP
jgi:hypothetical protein